MSEDHLTAFVRSPHKIARRETTTSGENELQVEEHQLNGQPAIVCWTGDRPFAALLLAVADGKIQRVFFHADLSRLRYLGRRSEVVSLRSTRHRHDS